MNLNLYNNFRAMYYNTLANFYLCFNTFVPYYDDVIISLSITSFKNIINNNLNLKSIKKIIWESMGWMFLKTNNLSLIIIKSILFFIILVSSLMRLKLSIILFIKSKCSNKYTLIQTFYKKIWWMVVKI